MNTSAAKATSCLKSVASPSSPAASMEPVVSPVTATTLVSCGSASKPHCSFVSSSRQCRSSSSCCSPTTCTRTVTGTPPRATSTSPWFTTSPSRWPFTHFSCSTSLQKNFWGTQIGFRFFWTLNFYDWFSRPFDPVLKFFTIKSVIFLSFWQGVLLALLEKMDYILPICDATGKTVKLTPGTISAGYQNFLVCIEMFFAAIALRYAFPISVYLSEGHINGSAGRSVTMQSISSSLKVC